MIINQFDQFSMIIHQLSHAWGGLPGRVPDPNYKSQRVDFSLLGGLEFGGLFGLPLGLQKLRKWSSKYRKLLPILDPGDLGSTTRLLGGLAQRAFPKRAVERIPMRTGSKTSIPRPPRSRKDRLGPPRTASETLFLKRAVERTSIRTG